MLSRCGDAALPLGHGGGVSGGVLGAVIAGPAVCEGVRAAPSEGFEQSVGPRALLHSWLHPGSFIIAFG